MRITVFSTGRARRKRAERGVPRYFNSDWGAETIPVNIFLIEHPAGLCLVDAGQNAAAASPGYFPSWYPFFRLSRFELEPGDEAAPQIRAAGFDLKKIRWVVLTHMHTDHVGGIGAFPDADVIVSREEWEPAQGWRGRLRGYLPQYWPSRIRPTLVDFEGPPVGPFARSHDIVGDGRLLLVPLHGHTSGHAALLVREPDKMCLCAGDAAMRASEFAAAAPAVAEWCRDHSVVVLTSHDDSARAMLTAR
jgi:N-acyl homoserine lactone hydrolase